MVWSCELVDARRTGSWVVHLTEKVIIPEDLFFLATFCTSVGMIVSDENQGQYLI